MPARPCGTTSRTSSAATTSSSTHGRRPSTTRGSRRPTRSGRRTTGSASRRRSRRSTGTARCGWSTSTARASRPRCSSRTRRRRSIRRARSRRPGPERARSSSCGSPACARTTGGWPTSAARHPIGGPGSPRCSSTTSTRRSPRFAGRRMRACAACSCRATTFSRWRTSTTRTSTRCGRRAPRSGCRSTGTRASRPSRCARAAMPRRWSGCWRRSSTSCARSGT